MNAVTTQKWRDVVKFAAEITKLASETCDIVADFNPEAGEEAIQTFRELAQATIQDASRRLDNALSREPKPEEKSSRGEVSLNPPRDIKKGATK